MLIIALLCSAISTPDHRDCVIDNSLRHEALGEAAGLLQCQMAGQFAIARWPIRGELEYGKVLCVLPGAEAHKRG